MMTEHSKVRASRKRSRRLTSGLFFMLARMVRKKEASFGVYSVPEATGWTEVPEVADDCVSSAILLTGRSAMSALRDRQRQLT